MSLSYQIAVIAAKTRLKSEKTKKAFYSGIFRLHLMISHFSLERQYAFEYSNVNLHKAILKRIDLLEIYAVKFHCLSIREMFQFLMFIYIYIYNLFVCAS